MVWWKVFIFLLNNCILCFQDPLIRDQESYLFPKVETLKELFYKKLHTLASKLRDTTYTKKSIFSQ